jgi:SPX domain protein involved in polyphosphate accumulation
MKQDNEKDGDEKSKTEKDFEKELEKEIEKNIPSFSTHYMLKEMGNLDLLEIQTALVIKNEKFISELFSSLPELPPELA